MRATWGPKVYKKQFIDGSSSTIGPYMCDSVVYKKR